MIAVWPPEAADFQFLRPAWLAALPFALWAAWRHSRPGGTRSAWTDVVDASLLTVLLEVPKDQSRRIAAVLLALALVAATLALAGPTWTRIEQPVERRDDALVIALDLSLSMHARDLQPSRLVRARLKLTDLLRERQEGHTALIGYAGDAHVVTPLTDDVATIENLLATLTPEMMPVLGSKPRSALDAAHGLFESAGVARGRILLVTDSIDRLADVTEACTADFPVSVLGVGTAAGARIPLDFVGQRGKFLTDRSGREIEVGLDSPRLENAAARCHGRYHTITAGDEDLASVLDIESDVTVEEDPSRFRYDAWIDAGQWLVLVLIPFALLGFRRGVLLSCALLVVDPVQASLWDDLWLRADQQAYERLRDGEPEQAVPLFEDPQWQAVARYRSGDFAGAAERFAADASADGHYNRANALAMQGRLPEAIAAYDQALTIDPVHADAQYNKALIERLLKEQQQAEGNANQDPTMPRDAEQQPEINGSESGDSDQVPSTEDAEVQPSKSGEESDQQSDDSEQDQKQLADTSEPPRDEQQEALEQWMRRVPDDPSGLLRRKFQYETNQRMRRGEYPDRDEERFW